ncbi:MAG: hypothetical protein H0W64_05195 [Gammaproteobacteria bacterium]|nr:hypothetical protein [Gammaproteobacteria bacterium]
MGNLNNNNSVSELSQEQIDQQWNEQIKAIADLKKKLKDSDLNPPLAVYFDDYNQIKQTLIDLKVISADDIALMEKDVNSTYGLTHLFYPPLQQRYNIEVKCEQQRILEQCQINHDSYVSRVGSYICIDLVLASSTLIFGISPIFLAASVMVSALDSLLTQLCSLVLDHQFRSAPEKVKEKINEQVVNDRNKNIHQKFFELTKDKVNAMRFFHPVSTTPGQSQVEDQNIQASTEIPPPSLYPSLK